jgi:uracil-DNA glycosylase family 4
MTSKTADDFATPSDPFLALVERVAGCRRCPAMEGRRRVLSPLNGPVHARLLFIAEAPGRLGGDRCGVPLSADQSGRNFERLLAAAGLTRAAVFVTNAVLCNPRDDRGHNRPPHAAELARCADHLRAQLALIAAPVVVTLGVTALRALDAVRPAGDPPHGLVLRQAVGRPVRWGGRWLVPLYHPGPQALLHRGFAAQAEDYRRLAHWSTQLSDLT